MNSNLSQIQRLRAEINELTLEMVHLLHKRREIAKRIGKAKKEMDKDLKDKKRESELRLQVLSLCKKIDLDKSSALSLLDFLIEDSLRAQSSQQKT